MKRATVCFPLTSSKILLGKKKERFGIGKWNGFGGKIQEGETPEEAAVRELREESGLVAQTADLEKVAILKFYFNDEPKFLMHSYVVRVWHGKPQESDEMMPQWHSLSDIPYNKMWKADSIWIGKVLNGEKVAANVYFKIDGEPGKDQETFDRIEYDDSLWQLIV
ncbi:hypothetical protein A3D62_00705 [Candidatus Kaiserbacteria bacterium RIFCSPHIGHO2_02_FULL_49_11]|uniref:Oxidized purine nucleoside triphosphate hydrolase n=1 Tax=Candidatus Kaiserbacteria bacterium RIFCSPHIGHO2_02_FULL_49_11 TaxID=1798489 RepID=A0A1F6D109_9BACT|nr:MAG: hypothetical protein A3D62_00705 [Candidatus Kaiserbacteria bacterium RIFCSPHIGHO2_02_FULL_49_11]